MSFYESLFYMTQFFYFCIWVKHEYVWPVRFFYIHIFVIVVLSIWDHLLRFCHIWPTWLWPIRFVQIHVFVVAVFSAWNIHFIYVTHDQHDRVLVVLENIFCIIVTYNHYDQICTTAGRISCISVAYGLAHSPWKNLFNKKQLCHVNTT
jgi:hypothetical protein